MAFINEYVPEDEIEKYGLDELWNRYNPHSYDKMPKLRSKGNNPLYWTIDRQQSCWLICFGPVMSYEHSRWLEPTNELIFILYWQGQYIDVRLFKSDKSSKNIYNPPPFKIIWECLSITPENIKEQVLPILKQALIVFGFDGIYRQVPNTEVEFKF